ELYLVHRGDYRPGRDDLLKVSRAEVRDADGAGQPLLAGALHPRPRPGGAALRPVHEVQVHLVDSQAAQALPGLGDRVAAPRIELRGDEHVLARHAAFAQRPADAFLVAVRL